MKIYCTTNMNSIFFETKYESHMTLETFGLICKKFKFICFCTHHINRKPFMKNIILIDRIQENSCSYSLKR